MKHHTHHKGEVFMVNQLLQLITKLMDSKELNHLHHMEKNNGNNGPKILRTGEINKLMLQMIEFHINQLFKKEDHHHHTHLKREDLMAQFQIITKLMDSVVLNHQSLMVKSNGNNGLKILKTGEINKLMPQMRDFHITQLPKRAQDTIIKNKRSIIIRNITTITMMSIFNTLMNSLNITNHSHKTTMPSTVLPSNTESKRERNNGMLGLNILKIGVIIKP